MLLPAATGSGASDLVRVNRVVDCTVVVTAAPLTGAASLQSMLYVPLVMSAPLATGALVETIIWADPELPEATAPRVQLTPPAASGPPPVAPTKVVPAGSVAAITTTEA